MVEFDEDLSKRTKDMNVTVSPADDIYEDFGRCLLNEEFGWLMGSMYNAPQNPVIVEIGSCRGTSTLAICKGLQAFKKGGQVFCIDPWTGTRTDLEGWMWKKEIDMGPDAFYQEFEANMKKHDIFHMITPIKKKSNDAYSSFLDNSIDFLFIDGDHEYDALTDDMRLWLPKVKKTGVFCGHDYNLPTVEKAVRDFAKTNNFFYLITTARLWNMMIGVDFKIIMEDIKKEGIHNDKVEIRWGQFKPVEVFAYNKEEFRKATEKRNRNITIK